MTHIKNPKTHPSSKGQTIALSYPIDLYYTKARLWGTLSGVLVMFIAGYFTVAMARADADLTLLLIGWGFMLLSGLGLLIIIIRAALKKPALRINADSLEYFNLFKVNKKIHIGWDKVNHLLLMPWTYEFVMHWRLSIGIDDAKDQHLFLKPMQCAKTKQILNEKQIADVIERSMVNYLDGNLDNHSNNRANNRGNGNPSSIELIDIPMSVRDRIQFSLSFWLMVIISVIGLSTVLLILWFK